MDCADSRWSAVGRCGWIHLLRRSTAQSTQRRDAGRERQPTSTSSSHRSTPLTPPANLLLSSPPLLIRRAVVSPFSFSLRSVYRRRSKQRKHVPTAHSSQVNSTHSTTPHRTSPTHSLTHLVALTRKPAPTNSTHSSPLSSLLGCLVLVYSGLMRMSARDMDAIVPSSPLTSTPFIAVLCMYAQ